MSERKLVEASEWLYRRGYNTPQKKFLNPDGTPTSRVFKLRNSDYGELSVDVKSLTNPQVAIKDSSTYFLFELENKIVVEQELLTYHHPLEDGTNNAHAVITGMSNDDEVTPAILARKSRRVFH